MVHRGPVRVNESLAGARAGGGGCEDSGALAMAARLSLPLAQVSLTSR
jgi:hypothetical protein